jgi:hypothetical protein
MGVLDDAIREHLELKRRHGASEGEVTRQEQEALGAPRRAPVQESAAAEPVATEPEPEAVAPAEPDVEPVAAEAAPEPTPAAAEPEPVEPPPVEEQLGEPAPDEAGDTPPRGFEPVEQRPAGEAADEEDVLEETPEFLQETPEHDRLWFEQKPPREFDFDDDHQ